jgi:hypothetical protein
MEDRMIDEQKALDLINNQDETAYGLLIAANPNFDKRFNRVCRTIRELLRDVQKEFPDAQYYTASGGFNLMIGPSHDDDANPQRELLACHGAGMEIGDGDF